MQHCTCDRAIVLSVCVLCVQLHSRFVCVFHVYCGFQHACTCVDVRRSM